MATAQPSVTRRGALKLGLAAGPLAAVAPVLGKDRLANRPAARAVTALGWYVLFAHPTQAEAMERHYATLLGLPLYRRTRPSPGQVQSKDLFWFGETTIFDLSYQGAVVREDARQAPVMRVIDVDRLVAEIRQRGGSADSPVDGLWGREAFITDPMGQRLGLRSAPARSPLAADREARRRAYRGEAFNPGCAAMPQGWQELGWVQIRAADPAKVADFYARVLDMPIIARRGGSVLLDIGDAVTLEITGGGRPRPVPAAQYESTAAIIVRVNGLKALSARLRAAGVPQVGKGYQTKIGDWTYFADPEGNVIGLCEWNHPSVYAADTRPEPTDLEARRRAIEDAHRRLN